MGTLYDTDIVVWAAEQAQLLRGRQSSALDIENIAEEIDSVGRTEKRELGSAPSVSSVRKLPGPWQECPASGLAWQIRRGWTMHGKTR